MSVTARVGISKSMPSRAAVASASRAIGARRPVSAWIGRAFSQARVVAAAMLSTGNS